MDADGQVLPNLGLGLPTSGLQFSSQDPHWDKALGGLLPAVGLSDSRLSATEHSLDVLTSLISSS
jgi:hypothetical protein